MEWKRGRAAAAHSAQRIELGKWMTDDATWNFLQMRHCDLRKMKFLGRN